MDSSDIEFPPFSNDEEYYDDNAVYEAEAKNLMLSDPRLDIPLYEQPRDDRDGAVRTTYKGGERGQLLYNKDKADYALQAERLVWIDGWRETTEYGGHKKHLDEMTLVVLKLAFQTKTPNSKVAFAAAELRFKSGEKTGKDPEVVAWGPFRYSETWNSSSAQRKVNFKAEGKLGLNQLTAGLTAENETAWDRIDFDSGSSAKLFSATKKSQVANGVVWKVGQNQLHKQGITPELRVAALFRRSPGPYKADFRLEAYTGTISEIMNRTMNLLGSEGGESTFWTVTPSPGKTENCHGEGLDIIKSIDVDNLGKLLNPEDNTNLNHSWLSTWGRSKGKVGSETPKIGEAVDEITANIGEAGASMTAAQVLEDPPRSPEPGNSSVMPVLQTTSLSATDYSRLIGLETRIAQAETRLKDQDQLIFKLQKAVEELKGAL
ncbi:hypothetical protein Hte_007270 [Hypoxylon texense]